MNDRWNMSVSRSGLQASIKDMKNLQLTNNPIITQAVCEVQ